MNYQTISARLTLRFFLSDILKHTYLRQHFQMIYKHILGLITICLYKYINYYATFN